MTQNTENSMETTRIVGRPFPKGQSGNPGGRPRSLAPYIREITGNGEELVDLMVTVMRGESINGMKPRIKDQIDAATWLSDRGFGKPITQIEATSRSMSVDMTLSELSSEKLIALLGSASGYSENS